MKRFALLLLFAAAPVSAQKLPTDAELATFSGPRATPEARLDADLNGDGKTDTVFVENGNDRRVLHVLINASTGKWTWRDEVGRYELDSAALGSAELSFGNKVLVVKDLTGGTSAVEATYRYRWEPATKKMRLIGIDASSYSRTFDHDTFEISWNLLTGTFVTRQAKLRPKDGKSEQAFFDPVVKTRKRPSKPVWLNQTPAPLSLIDPEPWG